MTNTQPKRSFGHRLLWIFRTTFISLLLIVILGGLVWAAYYGTTELQRSFNSLGQRIEANKQRIDLVNDDVAGMKAEDAAGNVSALQTQVADLESRLTAQQEQTEQLLAEAAQQEEMLTTLEGAAAAAATTSETAVADTAALGDALIALQNDINESNSRLDSLGGEIDGLRIQTDLVSAAADVAISDAELETMRQTVALFQIWEHIARARLHLSENNIGLATAEVAQTVRLMHLVITVVDEDAAALEQMQTRLMLAFDSLPDDPETAVLDLENAWSQLNAILTARLYPDVDVETILGETAVSEAEAAETQAETETEEEAETATPEATPTPTATPSG